MSKCKTIDRLALTRQSSRLLNRNDALNKNDTPQSEEPRGDICTQCGQPTLRHTEGCVQCDSCGYFKCG